MSKERVAIDAEEGKMNAGTLFDEENKFVFNNKKVDKETINKLGIKIYKKVLK